LNNKGTERKGKEKKERALDKLKYNIFTDEIPWQNHFEQ
jgi:hypothetical protein